MNATTNPAAAVTASGGAIEPASRSPAGQGRASVQRAPQGERYELRDPFEEVTYRADKLGEIIARADQLGSHRFTAIAADGARTVVEKAGSEWRRQATLPPVQQRPLDLTPDQESGLSEGSHTRLDKPPLRPEPPDSRVAAKIDAKADHEALVARIEAALKDRYVIKRAPVTLGALSIGHTEYRFRGDSTRVAFTESTLRLATDTNSPSVARSMVDVAQARNWQGVRVSGSEDFRRMVWLEASVRGVRAVGYEPSLGDLDALKRERDSRQTNRIEPAPEARLNGAPTATEKVSGRGGGRKAVVAAIDAVLTSRNVPEAKRAAVLVAVTEKLAQRVRSGPAPKVKVFDLAARPQRTTPVVNPEPARTPERPAPAHAR